MANMINKTASVPTFASSNLTGSFNGRARIGPQQSVIKHDTQLSSSFGSILQGWHPWILYELANSPRNFAVLAAQKLETPTIDNYMMTYRQTTFCPCPSGDSPSAKRMFDALHAGCIPTILSHDVVWLYSPNSMISSPILLRRKALLFYFDQRILLFESQRKIIMWQPSMRLVTLTRVIIPPPLWTIIGGHHWSLTYRSGTCIGYILVVSTSAGFTR